MDAAPLRLAKYCFIRKHGLSNKSTEQAPFGYTERNVGRGADPAVAAIGEEIHAQPIRTTVGDSAVAGGGRQEAPGRSEGRDQNTRRADSDRAPEARSVDR